MKCCMAVLKKFGGDAVKVMNGKQQYTIGTAVKVALIVRVDLQSKDTMIYKQLIHYWQKSGIMKKTAIQNRKILQQIAE